MNLIPIVTVGALVGTIMFGSERESSVVRTGLDRPYTAPAQGYCGYCSSSICADPIAHAFVASGFLRISVGLDHSCLSFEGGGCPHIDCTGFADNSDTSFEEAVEALSALAADGGVMAVSRMTRILARYPDRVELNVERAAIQVTTSCSQDMIAVHIPLAHDVLSQILAGRQSSVGL